MAKRMVGFQILLTEEEAKELESNVWISEYLRYAGCVDRPHIEYVKLNDVAPTRRTWVLSVYCNYRGLDVDRVVDMNIQRMASFGKKCVPIFKE